MGTSEAARRGHSGSSRPLTDVWQPAAAAEQRGPRVGALGQQVRGQHLAVAVAAAPARVLARARQVRRKACVEGDGSAGAAAWWAGAHTACARLLHARLQDSRGGVSRIPLSGMQAPGGVWVRAPLLRLGCKLTAKEDARVGAQLRYEGRPQQRHHVGVRQGAGLAPLLGRQRARLCREARHGAAGQGGQGHCMCVWHRCEHAVCVA